VTGTVKRRTLTDALQSVAAAAALCSAVKVPPEVATVQLS